MLQESYDNAGLICGDTDRECTGILTCLDATVEVIEEAISKGLNMVVAHHPILFSGLKKINGNSYEVRAVVSAIRHDIAIYAIHTNLDNIITGVNARMADKLGLTNRKVLAPKQGVLKKLIVFVPGPHAESVRNALFEAGAGNIGNYSECSFSTGGTGSFKPGREAQPFIGKTGERHLEEEVKIEVIYPLWLHAPVLKAMFLAHPYEEVAYDLLSLDNDLEIIGSGLIGHLPEPMEEQTFLKLLKESFGLSVIKYTNLQNKMISKVALCGGSGSFLLQAAISKEAEIFVTADMKYHEFFNANNQIVIADIGHYESEQFTIDLLYDLLREKFATFAVQKTAINTNPVHYFL